MDGMYIYILKIWVDLDKELQGIIKPIAAFSFSILSKIFDFQSLIQTNFFFKTAQWPALKVGYAQYNYIYFWSSKIASSEPTYKMHSNARLSRIKSSEEPQMRAEETQPLSYYRSVKEIGFNLNC